MTINDEADLLHDAAVRLFGIHAENPAIRGFGIPGAGMGMIWASNSLACFVRSVQSERAARAAVSRCRAARRPLRPKEGR